MTASSVPESARWRSKATLVLASLVIVQLLMLVPKVVADRSETRGELKTLTRLETGLPAGAPLMIETGLAGALTYAQTWQPDAFLFAASMQIDWPNSLPNASSSDIPQSGWILYTFGSSDDETLSIMVDRISGVVIGEQRVEWSGTPARRIPQTTYPISSITAIFATETTIGATYRIACPEFRNLSRVSFVPFQASDRDQGNADGGFWVVSYEDTRSLGRPAFVVRIDATNGSVDRSRVSPGGIPSCD